VSVSQTVRPSVVKFDGLIKKQILNILFPTSGYKVILSRTYSELGKKF